MNYQEEKPGLPFASGNLQWMVAHTRPRCEKRIEEFCHNRGFTCFLPQVSRAHRYGARRRVYRIPLFPGYVFVLADSAGSSLLRGNRHVANLLEVHDQATLVNQLNQVKLALDHEAPVELLPQFTTGMKVTVQDGPFKGVEGLVERVKNNTRIILNVDFIQQSIAVEVNTEWLIPR